MSKTDFICLDQYSLIEVSGADAEHFLQGQLTCDVTKLAIGDSTFTAHCDPKGKITSFFRLICVTKQQFYFLIRTNLVPIALDQIKKYAVFSKVAFTTLDYPLVGVIGQAQHIEALIKITLDDRTLLISPQNTIEYTATMDLWDLHDMQQGYPIFTAELQHKFIPQTLNIQYLEQAISFQKGCYIGQETVARAKYRGINKRAMYTLYAETTATPSIDSEVEMWLNSQWRRTGTIISTVNVDGFLWLQVILQHPLEKSVKFRLPSTEVPLKFYTLPYMPE